MIAHTSPIFMYQFSYCQIRIKVTICQTDSIMTLNCELRQDVFSVLYGKLIIKLPKIYFLCTYVEQIIIQQRFNVLLQFQFFNILKIYELPRRGDRRVLQIFQKKFHSPGDHRPKYFMAH